MTAAAAGGALVAENHDPACALCHLPPEATAVARRRSVPPVDLAAGHAVATEGSVRCIDCHAGPTARDRLGGLVLGARDGMAWATGRYVAVGGEYAPLGRSAYPISDDVCLACHADVPDEPGFAAHYHNLLADPEAPPVPCASCHRAHAPAAFDNSFLVEAAAAGGCDACHSEMGGPFPVLDVANTGSAAP